MTGETAGFAIRQINNRAGGRPASILSPIKRSMEASNPKEGRRTVLRSLTAYAPARRPAGGRGATDKNAKQLLKFLPSPSLTPVLTHSLTHSLSWQCNAARPLTPLLSCRPNKAEYIDQRSRSPIAPYPHKPATLPLSPSLPLSFLLHVH